MPWVLSAILHVGVFLIMLFIVMVVQSPAPQVVAAGPVPDYSLPVPLSGFKNTESGSGQSAPPARRPVSRQTERDVEIAPGESDKQVNLVDPLNGHGKSPTGWDLVDGNGPGNGIFDIKDPPGGMPLNIVYVVDRSGSMVNTFGSVKSEMIRSISRLNPGQCFHVVLFGDGKTIEGPRRRLIAASNDNKVAAVRFLQQQSPFGVTTALVALKRAFDVLAAAPPDQSKLIYLVSDGDFSGITGGSRYRTADGRTLNGNEAVLQWLADKNAGPKIYIQTVLLHSTDQTAVKVLKTIANQNGGRFKYVSPDE